MYVLGATIRCEGQQGGLFLLKLLKLLKLLRLLKLFNCLGL